MKVTKHYADEHAINEFFGHDGNHIFRKED